MQSNARLRRVILNIATGFGIGSNNLLIFFYRSVEKGNHIEKGWPDRQFSEYSVSKIGLSALTRVQQRHFDRDPIRRDINVNSVHPGIIETDMNRYFPATHTVEEGINPHELYKHK